MTITSETFVDAAAHVCTAAAELGMAAAVELHRTSNRTGILVDNYADVTDELRRFVLTEEYWQVSPMKVELHRQVAVLGPDAFDLPSMYAVAREKGFIGATQLPVGVPLLSPDGCFGTVGYSSQAGASAAVERRLLALATELSVWCTARGISTLPDVRPLAPRQHEVATLAADGRTNLEIADELDISINTVKLRLKQAFERLGVENRTELANMLRRLAPLDGIPPGVTRRGPVTITRGAMIGADRVPTRSGVAR